MFALGCLLYEDMAYLLEKKAEDQMSWWMGCPSEDEAEKSQNEENQAEKDSKSGKNDGKEEGKMGPSCNSGMITEQLLAGRAYGRSVQTCSRFNLPTVLLPVATPPPERG